MTNRIQAGQRLSSLRQRPGVCAVIAAVLLSSQLCAHEEDSNPPIYPQAVLSLTSLVAPSADVADSQPATGAAETVAADVPAVEPENTNAVATAATAEAVETNSIGTVPAPVETVGTLTPDIQPAAEVLVATNELPRERMSEEEYLVHLKQRLENARYLRTTRQAAEAEPLLIELLNVKGPEVFKQAVLLELAAAVQDQNHLPRAQQIYSQFLQKWPDDTRVPEILLRQGLIFRQMGLYTLALTKFYGVMTSSLVLKNDQFDYYVRLVQNAQAQIAETHYELGKFGEAADFFNRLLKQNNTEINKPQVLYKLTRCHAALGKHAEAVADAQEFLTHHADAPEQPEVRFHLATALKHLGRDNESLQQVLLLLQEQRAQNTAHPERWAYWQQRTGGFIANLLFKEGSYTKALEIYLSLAALDRSVTWQVPLHYQIGMTYENLMQPGKAMDTYAGIIDREKEVGTNAPPGLKAVFDMARWRIDFIRWQSQAEAANRRLVSTNALTASVPPPRPPNTQ